MRPVLISLAAAASALALATPASAQYFPVPQGYAYGHQGNYGQVRRLQARIDHIQRQIRILDRRNILSDREARRLRQDSRELERRLRFAARDGLHPQERYHIERRLARLEHRLFRDARDGNRRGYYDGRQGGFDRDRDGRDDRWERDRHDRDDRRDRDRRRDRDDDDDD
ncbi:hypothetical protein [Sphingomonas sp.]|uniref:hypothetical protein n=1 Tax=Sphingomonas sp. TaxID=28214 RepID=UPI0017D19D58|nr:hypothetical protein [Sphingomonas sp.]MBA3511001.1 hypothetical protein [Sphingomonas sp.]